MSIDHQSQWLVHSEISELTVFYTVNCNEIFSISDKIKKKKQFVDEKLSFIQSLVEKNGWSLAVKRHTCSLLCMTVETP